MKQAIMIGAGNIGRGFIGALLEKSGYHVTFADVAENLISAINERKQYTVHIQDRECAQWTVTNISGISSASNPTSLDAFCIISRNRPRAFSPPYASSPRLRLRTLKSKLVRVHRI